MKLLDSNSNIERDDINNNNNNNNSNNNNDSNNNNNNDNVTFDFHAASSQRTAGTGKQYLLYILLY